MNFGVCCLSVIPVRADVSSKSEMISQLLFGETFIVLSSTKGWTKIVIDHDSYEGWIDEKQYIPISNDEHTLLYSIPKYYSTELVQTVKQENDRSISILPGSVLYNTSGSEFLLGGKTYLYNGQSIEANVRPSVNKMILNAFLFLNSPYLWGGRSPFGIDCSGFVQVVARLSGLSLPRDTHQQAEEGEMINMIAEAKPGDLAFFDNEEGRIIHVGIMLENAQIIHASGLVRIDTIDHQGIFREDTKKYTHKLRVIKRIIE